MRTAIAAGAVAWLAPGLAPHLPPLAAALGIRRCIDAPGVALTFDDGPHPDGTPRVLDELARRDAHATFFLVGEQVERRPSLAAEIVACGHTVALHGYRHRNLMRLTPRALADDLRRAVAVIGEATGKAVSVYRPPYGIFTPAGLAIARRERWTPLLWSRWGCDWTLRHGPAAIAERATREIGEGDVVLLHDSDFYSEAGSWRNTAAALSSIIDSLERRGLPTITAAA